VFTSRGRGVLYYFFGRRIEDDKVLAVWMDKFSYLNMPILDDMGPSLFFAIGSSCPLAYLW
jgi:hypothetical protein